MGFLFNLLLTGYAYYLNFKNRSTLQQTIISSGANSIVNCKFLCRNERINVVKCSLGYSIVKKLKSVV